jgi:hypothetical protein
MPSAGIVRASVVLAVAVTACSELSTGPAIPALPGAGGPPWIEVASAHVLMWTDAPSPRAHELIGMIERHRQIVLHGLALPDGATRMFVIVLRDSAELAGFADKPSVAYSWPQGNLPLWPTLVFAADALYDRDNRAAIDQQIAHAGTDGVMRVQPHWFGEGVAAYYARPHTYGPTVEVGRPLTYIRQRLAVHGAMPVAELVACESPACSDTTFYASAWALVAMLAEKHPAELHAYVQRLAQTVPGDTAPALDVVVPALTPAALDRELSDWLGFKEARIDHFDLPVHDWPATDRPLRDADVLAVRAALRGELAPDAPATRDALAAAIAADPTGVLPRLAQRVVSGHVPAEDVHAMAAAHPDDWRAWWLLGFTIRSGEEAKIAADKLCAMMAADPAVAAAAFVPQDFCR